MNNPLVEAWMKRNGFKYHVDVLNHFWEKGDFRNKDYIKVTDNAATFFYNESKQAVINHIDQAIDRYKEQSSVKSPIGDAFNIVVEDLEDRKKQVQAQLIQDKETE